MTNKLTAMTTFLSISKVYQADLETLETLQKICTEMRNDCVRDPKQFPYSAEILDEILSLLEHIIDWKHRRNPQPGAGQTWRSTATQELFQVFAAENGKVTYRSTDGEKIYTLPQDKFEACFERA